MAASSTTVGDAFLSAPIQTMIDKLTSTDFQDYANNNKLSLSLVTQLQTALLALAPVLDDAEKKQIHYPGIRKWLDELKDAIFDAEDLLNQISYDSLRCKVRNPRWNFLSSLFNNSEDINSQLKTVCERLQLFAQQIDNLGLQTVSHKVLSRIPISSSSSLNEYCMVSIVGRENDKEKLIKMLLSERDNDKNNLGVVAIVGIGGLGKTTLAKLVYSDFRVKNHFDLKAWASVSLDFDILEITRSLLKTVTLGNWDTNDLHILRAELKKNLRGKRFLFVLDDVWERVYDNWIDLVSPFVGKSGSKVIITTRSHSVAMMTGASHIYLLGGLSREDSWSLLLKDVFALGGSVDPMLEYIGQSVARKCGGLPLALKALAGLLRTNLDAEYWDAISNSDIWDLPANDVMPALHVSYQYLPSHLKRCFTYCSIFPKDYPLDRKQLVLLWMAEGLVEKSLDSKEAEKICDEFFDELISRSLIQQSNDDTEEEKIFMHDFIRLATYVAGTSCCRLEYGTKISKNVRHLSYNREKLDISMNCEIFHDFKCLRTFLPVGPLWGQNCLPRQVLDDFLPTLIRLRVLSLSKYKDIKKLPESLGNLTQLRYLDLSNTGIKSLPDTICNLYNLQTLILSNCCHLIDLPSHIGMLINLCHLDISGTKIREMPMQITKLEKLQTLTVFIVGKSQVGLSIKELRKFQYLRGKLTILNLHNVIDSMEAFAANLKSKQQIEELVLQWGEQTECCEVQLVLLDMLQPSITLKKLSINYYGGKIFPSWLGDSSFSYMVYLSISDCEYCRTLPPLGQLSSLKHLRIDGMKRLKTIGPEFYGMVGEGSRSSFQPFPSLQNLQFRNMSSWKEWLPFEGGKFPFPCLQTLRLQKCPELKGHLPNHPPSIQEIIIIDCGRLLETPSTLHCLSSLENKNIVYLK